APLTENSANCSLVLNTRVMQARSTGIGGFFSSASSVLFTQSLVTVLVPISASSGSVSVPAADTAWASCSPGLVPSNKPLGAEVMVDVVAPPEGAGSTERGVGDHTKVTSSTSNT